MTWPNLLQLPVSLCHPLSASAINLHRLSTSCSTNTEPLHCLLSIIILSQLPAIPNLQWPCLHVWPCPNKSSRSWCWKWPMPDTVFEIPWFIKIQLRSELLAHYQLVLLVNLNCDIEFKRDRDARCTLLAREDELFVMKLQPTLGSGMSISAY